MAAVGSVIAWPLLPEIAAGTGLIAAGANAGEGLAGCVVANAIAGGQAGKNAIENNHLSPDK